MTSGGWIEPGVLRSAVCLLALVIAGSPSLEAQAPKADDVLRLAGAYVEDFIDAFSNVVAEERYTQEVIRPRQRRTLRSDFLLVRYPGAARWHAFRDVLEVDGKPIDEDREGRLAVVFRSNGSNSGPPKWVFITNTTRFQVSALTAYPSSMRTFGFGEGRPAASSVTSVASATNTSAVSILPKIVAAISGDPATPAVSPSITGSTWRLIFADGCRGSLQGRLD